MPDREKVVKGLEICSDCGFCESIKKFDLRCPYRNNDGKGCDKSQLLMDALSMLKEQEAVEPILIREGRNKYYNDYVCPNCDNELSYGLNYCSVCGVKFMWKGR